MRELFEAKLPEGTIKKDLASVLAECGHCVELGGRTVPVPREAKLEIVVRTWHGYEHPIGFGDLSVLVAIGGVKRIDHGVPEPGICFARLYYTGESKLITVDFMAQAY